MPEGQSGNFDKGQRPSAGELQARAAERIIEEAQRRPPQPNPGNEGAGSASTSATAQEHRDKHRLEDLRQTFKSHEEWKQRVFRKPGEPQTDKAPRLITAHGVATTPEEVDKVFAEIKKASDENLAKRFKEAAARLNTFSRLPFGEKLSMLLSGSPTDMDKYNQILQEERARLGLK